MGTTLQVQVEALYERDEYFAEQWQSEADRINLNKDYALMRALREHSTRGWPRDTAALVYGTLGVDHDRDEGLQWCSLDTFKLVLDAALLDDTYVEQEVTRALLAFCQAFDRPVRLLFWYL